MVNLHIPPVGNKHLMSPVFVRDKFSKEECHELVSNLTREKENSIDVLKRSSFAIGINLTKGNEWFFDKASSIIEEVNKQYYHFDLTDLRAVNFLEYQVNNSLIWHRDIGNEDRNFLSRKITMIVFLSDKDDYVGGKLGFIPAPDSEVVQEQGSVLLYPSYLVHNVSKVTSGIRRVILASAHGQPYR